MTHKRAKELLEKWRWHNQQYGCTMLSNGELYTVKCNQMIQRYKAMLRRKVSEERV